MAYGVRQVPQNIMSVEFKIFDFMTLKQFGISVGILLVCFALFTLLPTPWNIVIPIFIVLIGGVVIFVPFNGEPFQEFLSSYLEAMISSQRRIWHKKGIVVETAAEKARYYRFGNDPMPEGDNKFKFVDQNVTKVTQEQTQLDTAEQKFLTTNENPADYKPPIMNQAKPTGQNANLGTTVSQKSLHNNTNLGTFAKQQPQQQSQQLQQQSMPLQNATTQNNQPIPNQSMQQNQQPSYIAKEDNSQNPQQPIQSVSPLTQPIQPKKELIDDENEFAVKNFIFGSVEDWNGKPIRDAAVILQQNGRNLEVINTTDVGEFKTAYEYIAGPYNLYVNVDSQEFNNIQITHDPVDPIPYTITPKGERPITQQEEELSLETNVGNDEIFEGAYDAKIFDLGHDYVEKSNANSVPNQVVPQNLETQIQTPTQEFGNTPIQAQNQAPEISIPISASQRNEIPTSNYNLQANNMFNQMSSGRMPTVSSDIETTPAINFQNEPIPEVPAAVAVSQPVTQLHNFNALPNANIPFEENLVSIPDTINGVLVDPNGYGVQSAELLVLNQSGAVVTSTRSDQSGKFYSYSPIPQGTYTISIIHNNVNIGMFSVILNGNTIPPKFISFKY